MQIHNIEETIVPPLIAPARCTSARARAEHAEQKMFEP